MLRLSGGQVESLWDEVLPGEARELPEDLAALDVLLRDRGADRSRSRRIGAAERAISAMVVRRSRWRCMCV